ncbi:MAG: hypothetical protein AAGB00_00230 [Planctomycetota bacterium]
MTQHQPLLAAVLATLVAGQSAAQLVPPGLAPGETYHLTFTTSTTHGITGSTSVPPGNFPAFGGVDAADWVVTFNAFSAGLLSGWDFQDPEWRAVISNDDEDAIDRVGIQGPVYNLLGDRVADSEADFFDGQINVPLNVDEFGEVIASGTTEVWTGTGSDGRRSGSTCGDNWTNNASVASGLVGGIGTTAGSWSSAANASCNETARLYAISPAFTVPTPPSAFGDFDGDGVTAPSDYQTWRQDFGLTVDPWAGADGNGDGQIDAADYTVWRDQLDDPAVVGPLPTSLWTSGAGGAFEDPANWSAGVPGTGGVVAIDPSLSTSQTAGIPITLAADQTTNRALRITPTGSQVTQLNLGGGRYSLTGDPNAVGIGRAALYLRGQGEDNFLAQAKLEVAGGTLSAATGGIDIAEGGRLEVATDGNLSATEVKLGEGGAVSVSGQYAAAQTRLEGGTLSIITGATNISLGVLSGDGSVLLNADANIGRNFDSSFTPFTGTFSGGANLTKVGTGRQSFASPQPVPLAVIDAGTVEVADGGVLDGTLDFGSGVFDPGLNHVGGTLAPGGAGELGTVTVEGIYAQQPGATLHIELDAATGEADLLVVGGGFAELNGTIELAWVDGVPAETPPQSFQIIDPRLDLGGVLGGSVAFDFTDAPLVFTGQPIGWTADGFLDTGEIRIGVFGVAVPEPTAVSLLAAVAIGLPRRRVE